MYDKQTNKQKLAGVDVLLLCDDEGDQKKK